MYVDSFDTVNLATEPAGDSGGASPHNQNYLFNIFRIVLYLINVMKYI